jgi:hypothetical protein
MLYTFGCSYTEDEGEAHLKDNLVYHLGKTYYFPKWPKLLSQHLGMEYKNFGVGGAGNDQIFYHAVNEIVHNHNDIDTVAILWSAMWRFWVYGKNFNPVNVLTTDSSWSKLLDYEVYKHLLKELQYPNQATKFQINCFLKNITTLQKLCDDYNIKLLQWCGTGLVEYRTNQPNIPLIEQFYEELQKHNIDDTHIIGWPFISDLGGMTFWDINKDMTISEEDSHPNAKGHELIARYFYENTISES